MRTASIAIGATLMMVTAAAAAEAPRTVGPDALSRCRVLADNAARLSCYDVAVDRFETAVANHDVVVMDRDAVRQTRQGLFGFTLPKTPLFNGDNVRNSIVELDATVASASSLGQGKWRMRLDNGSIWETTEAIGWNAPKAGSKIHLKAGALGNYFMTIDRDNPIRAMRVG